MNNSGAGRSVTYFKYQYDPKTKQVEKTEERPGILRAWGVEFEELADGVGNYTVGIIEMPDGQICTAGAENIAFADGNNE